MSTVKSACLSEYCVMEDAIYKMIAIFCLLT